MKIKVFTIIASTVLLIFCGCKKDDSKVRYHNPFTEPYNPGVKVSHIRQSTLYLGVECLGQLSSYDLRWNWANDRVESLDWWSDMLNTPDPIHTTLQYDNQGRLASACDNSNGGLHFEYKDGRLATISYIRNNYSIAFHQFLYVGKNKYPSILIDGIYDDFHPSTDTLFLEWEDGNLMNVTSKGDAIWPEGEFTFTYDNNPNPLCGMPLCQPYCDAPEYFLSLFCRNNLTSIHFRNSETYSNTRHLQYEYTDNLPTQIVRTGATTAFGCDIIDTIKIEYK